MTTKKLNWRSKKSARRTRRLGVISKVLLALVVTMQLQGFALALLTNQIQYGCNDSSGCETYMMDMDFDQKELILMSGWTKSADILYGNKIASCRPGKVGFITQFKDEDLVWEKFFDIDGLGIAGSSGDVIGLTVGWARNIKGKRINTMAYSLVSYGTRYFLVVLDIDGQIKSIFERIILNQVIGEKFSSILQLSTSALNSVELGNFHYFVGTSNKDFVDLRISKIINLEYDITGGLFLNTEYVDQIGKYQFGAMTSTSLLYFTYLNEFTSTSGQFCPGFVKMSHNLVVLASEKLQNCLLAFKFFTLEPRNDGFVYGAGVIQSPNLSSYLKGRFGLLIFKDAFTTGGVTHVGCTEFSLKNILVTGSGQSRYLFPQFIQGFQAGWIVVVFGSDVTQTPVFAENPYLNKQSNDKILSYAFQDTTRIVCDAFGNDVRDPLLPFPTLSGRFKEIYHNNLKQTSFQGPIVTYSATSCLQAFSTKGISGQDFINSCALVRTKSGLASSSSVIRSFNENYETMASTAWVALGVIKARTASKFEYVFSLPPKSYISRSFSNAFETFQVMIQQLQVVDGTQTNFFIQKYDATQTHPKVTPYTQMSVPFESSVYSRVDSVTKILSQLSLDFSFFTKTASSDEDDGQVFTFYLAAYNSMNHQLFKTSIGYSTSCSTGSQVFASDQIWFNTYSEVDTVNQFNRFPIPEFRSKPFACLPSAVSVSNPIPVASLIIPQCGNPCLQTYVDFDTTSPTATITFTIQVTSPDGNSHLFNVIINLHAPGTCGTESLTFSGVSPFLLAYPKSDGSPTNDYVQELLSSQIRGFFASSSTTCNFIRFSLYEQGNSKIVPFSSSEIFLRPFEDITQSYIEVNTKKFLNKHFFLYGFTSESNSVSMALNVVVCGNEVMSAVSTDVLYRVMLRQGSVAGPVDQKPVLDTLYTFTNNDQAQYCLQGMTYRLFIDQALTSSFPSNSNLQHDSASQLDLSAGTVYQSPKLWLQIKTRGQSSVVKQADFTVCPEQTITMTPSSEISLYYDVRTNSHGLVDLQQVQFSTYGWNFQLSSDCSGACSKDIMEVTLIDLVTNGPFSDGGRTYLNTTTKGLMISTSKARLLYSFGIKGYYSHIGCSQIFSNTGLLKVSIEICGDEVVSSKESTPWRLEYVYEKDPALISMNRSVIEDLFEVKNTVFCVIGNFDLTNNLTSLDPLNSNGNIRKFINLDAKNNYTLDIFNDKMQNFTTKVWLVATTFGKKKGIREIDLDFSYIVNQAPKFSYQLIDHNILITEVDQKKGLEEPIYSYKSPNAKDQELNKVIMKFSGYILHCNCVEMRQLVTNEFQLTVDKAQLTKFDGGIHRVTVTIQDDKYFSTREVRKYTFILQILYVQADIIEKLTETVEKNKTTVVDLGPEVASEPVQLSVNKIWSNGSVDIEFNQNMTVPEIVQNNTITTIQRNLLVNLESDFVKQNVLTLEILQNSNLPEVFFNFSIDYWTHEGMQISLEFENPQFVSQGLKPDRLQISIIGPEYFRSNISGEILLNDKVNFFKNIPKQNSGGVLVETLKDNALQTTDAITGLIVAQLFAQVLLKTSMDDLWALFLSLQMICYVTYYNVTIPLNAEFYLIELKKLVEFQILNPEGLIRLFDPEFKLGNFFTNVKTSIASLPSDEVLPQTLLVDLRIFIYLIALALVALVILIILYRIPFLQQKTLNFLVILRGNLLWNGVIRSISISYLKFGITVGIQFKLWMTHFEYQGLADKAVACLIGLLILVYAAFTIYFLIKNKKRLNKDSFKKKYVNFYKNIKTKKKFSIAFYPIFLTRRLLFVFFPLVLMNNGTFQCICLIFMTELYIGAYATIKPHIDRRTLIVEITNEALSLNCFFLLLFFNDISLNPTMLDLLGQAFVVLTIGLIAFNIANMVLRLYESHQKSQRNFRMKKLAVIRNTRKKELMELRAKQILEAATKNQEVQEESSESESSSFQSESDHISIQDQSENKPIKFKVKTSNKINIVNRQIQQAYTSSSQGQSQNLGVVNALRTQAMHENNLPSFGKMKISKQRYEEPGQEQPSVKNTKYELPRDDEDQIYKQESSKVSEKSNDLTRLKKLGISLIFRQPKDPRSMQTPEEIKDYQKAQKKWIQISQPAISKNSVPSSTPEEQKHMSFYELAQMQLQKDNQDLEKGQHNQSFGESEKNIQVDSFPSHNPYQDHVGTKSFYTGNLSSMEFYEMPRILKGGPDASLTKIQLIRRENAMKRAQKQFE